MNATAGIDQNENLTLGGGGINIKWVVHTFFDSPWGKMLLSFCIFTDFFCHLLNHAAMSCWNHMDILSSPFLLRGLIIAKYWNYLSSFILDELLRVEKKSKTKSKCNHICIKYINNHLTEIWTDMLGIKEHYCKSFFLFAEQIIDSTRVIQAKAFLTNICIGDFVGWCCISLQAADQKLIARIFVFVASWEKVPLTIIPLFRWFSWKTGRLDILCSLQLSLLQTCPCRYRKQDPLWPTCICTCSIKDFLSYFVKG